MTSAIDQSMGDLNTMPRHEGPPSGPAGDAVRVGQRIGPSGRYQISMALGRGGMGEVFLARDAISQTDVAIKLVPREVSFSEVEMEELRRNFALVHNLHHPNIAAVTQLEQLPGGEFFLVMEAVPGRCTLHRMRLSLPERKIPLHRAFEIAAQLADAVDYAHSQGVLHRDIKPGNVMITPDGQVKLTDFGLAAQIATSMNRVSLLPVDTAGTRPYMAPEQWQDHLQDARTDQWAVAVVLYEMITGRLPFPARDPAVLERQALHHTPERARELSGDQWRVLLRGLAKDKEARHDSCQALARALRTARRPSRAPLALAVIAAMVVVAALAGTSLFVYHQMGLQPDGPDTVVTEPLTSGPGEASPLPSQVTVDVTAGGDPADTTVEVSTPTNGGESTGTRESAIGMWEAASRERAAPAQSPTPHNSMRTPASPLSGGDRSRIEAMWNRAMKGQQNAPPQRPETPPAGDDRMGPGGAPAPGIDARERRRIEEMWRRRTEGR